MSGWRRTPASLIDLTLQATRREIAQVLLSVELSTVFLNAMWFMREFGWDKVAPRLDVLFKAAFVAAFFMLRVIFMTRRVLALRATHRTLLDDMGRTRFALCESQSLIACGDWLIMAVAADGAVGLQCMACSMVRWTLLTEVWLQGIGGRSSAASSWRRDLLVFSLVHSRPHTACF